MMKPEKSRKNTNDGEKMLIRTVSALKKRPVGRPRKEKTPIQPASNIEKRNVGRPKKLIIVKEELNGDLNGKIMVQINPKTIIFINPRNKHKIKDIIKKLNKKREFSDETSVSSDY